MHIGVVGVNFKSSELFLREMLAKAFKRCFEAEIGFPCVLLSTCNRSELYFSSEDLANVHTNILAILRKEIDIPFEHVLYSYFGGECFAHLAAVTCGLDSAILAETEIQRQVKHSYALASASNTLPSSLHFLFQKCLKIGKAVRTAMPIKSGQESLEKILFQLSVLFVKEIKDVAILFIGNSEINRKILSFFKVKGISRITLCTRSPQKAIDLGIKIIDWSELSCWQEHEIVICGTNQEEYLISNSNVLQKGKSKLIFDLSVPRNIDPQLSRHPQIHLFNIEELSSMVDKRRRLPFSEIQKIDLNIREEVKRQIKIFYQKQQKSSIGAVCELF